MLQSLYIIYFSALNYIRGRGYSDKGGLWLLLSKAPIYIYMSLPMVYFFDWKAALFLFCNLMLVSFAGWGKVMQAMKGQGNINIVNNEPEFTLIDRLTNLITGEATTQESARLKAVLWGSLFGLLYCPILVYLGAVYNPIYLLAILPCTLFGVIPYFFKDWYKVEIVWGTTFASLLMLGA